MEGGASSAVTGYVPTPGKKKGPKTYKAAKGPIGKGRYSNFAGTKPATRKRIAMVDKKVKKVSNKIVRFHKEQSGPAAHNRY